MVDNIRYFKGIYVQMSCLGDKCPKTIDYLEWLVALFPKLDKSHYLIGLVGRFLILGHYLGQAS